MHKKNSFSSRSGFIMAAAGSAIGLANIWKFPYEVGHYGGGCFILLYLVCTVLLGYPLMLAELSLGRKTQSGLYAAYKGDKNDSWQLLGLFGAINVFLMYSFYCVIIGWILGYLWEFVCGNLMCSEDFNGFFKDFQANGYINMFYTAIVMVMIGWINKKGVSGGIEKLSKVLMPLFVLILIGLVVYSLTLSNAIQGLKFYFIPRWEFLSSKAVLAALGQSFMSLSVGLGVHVTFGAYNTNKKDNLLQSTAIIVIADTLVALFAGIFLFSFIFHKEHSTTTHGAELVFVLLPHMLKDMGPMIGLVIGVLFFLLLFFAAITSAVSMLEVFTKYFSDSYGFTRSNSILFASIGAFFLSIPSILALGGSDFFTNFYTCNNEQKSFFDFIIVLTTEIIVPLCVFFFSLFIAFKWKTDPLLEEIKTEEGTSKWFNFYIHISLKYLCPLLIGGTLVANIWQYMMGF